MPVPVSRWPIRRFFRLTWLLLCVLSLLALPLTIYDFSSRDYDIHFQACFIGGLFTIMSVPITIYEVAMHIEYYTRPRLQRHVIRILWMVPIYGIDAWFVLRFPSIREFLDPIREIYEAFVIYNFFAYLMAYLDEELGDVEEVLSKQPPVPHIFPVNLVVQPWSMGSEFLWECKKGILNYVVIRPLCTIVALITGAFGKYGQGQMDLHKSYIYLSAVTNFSQMWAMYCLILMYHKLHKELAPIRPVSKFIAVKAVVFVTFWQGLTIAVLVYSGVIGGGRSDSDPDSGDDDYGSGGGGWDREKKLDVATSIQDFLICIEMFVAALSHAYAFPPRDYMDPSQPRNGFLSNVRHMFDVRDLVDDTWQVVGEHANNVVGTASNVVDTGIKLPSRAVRKVSQGLVAAAYAPGNLFTYITTAASGSGAGNRKVALRVGLGPEDAEVRSALLGGEIGGSDLLVAVDEERGEAGQLAPAGPASLGGGMLLVEIDSPRIQANQGSYGELINLNDRPQEHELLFCPPTKLDDRAQNHKKK